MDPETSAEIDRVLATGGEIFILGGENAVAESTATELAGRGYAVSRLGGASRFETAADIARRVRQENPGSTDVMLAYAYNWPDAITGGAYGAETGVPIVLTDTGSLHPAAAQAMTDLGVQRTFVLGGTAVIDDVVAGAVPAAVRVAGSNRMATAISVAEDLWAPITGTVDTFVVANLERPDAWNLALAAAPLSARFDAPQIGVGADRYPQETEAYLASQGFTQQPAGVLVGDLTFIDQGVETNIAGTISRAPGP